MNQLPSDAILISANPNMVLVDDAVKHLASHEKLYWEVGFRIDKNRFSYPLFGFIHIRGGQVEYRALISDIVPFSEEHYKGPLAEQVKPKPWRDEWDENRNNVRKHPWKNALVMNEIVPFSYPTHAFFTVDGKSVQPPQSYVQVRLPGHLPGAPPISPTMTGKTNILETNLERIVKGNPEEVEAGLVWEKEQLVTKAGRLDLLGRDTNGNYVVVELKRAQGTDQVVGQILRYMGCLTIDHGKDKVRGIIIVQTKDQALSYAAMAVPNLQVKEFTIHLK
jgi:hypothetical protein